MDRLFQHYKGEIKELIGVEFSCVKALCDREESDLDVVLIWMQNKALDCWYRVFIDGVYCGVDCYEIDQSSDDIDDEVIVIDHSPWFSNKKISQAEVEIEPIKESSYILLTLVFSDHSEMQLNCLSEGGDCQLTLRE